MIGDASLTRDEMAALLAAEGPLPLEKMAERVNVTPAVLQRRLEAHPYLVPTPDGEWMNGLRLADGVTFTHELSAEEVAAEVLAADDDLALWAQFALDGLPLAADGVVKAATFLDLPVSVTNGLPTGQGMIGQVLIGPDGWLKSFAAGNLLAVSLRDGALEISTTKPPKPSSRMSRLTDVCALASVEALKRYVDKETDKPVAPLAELLVELLVSEPELFAAPLPSLARTLRAVGLETFGGHVGVPGAPWNLTRVRGLDRPVVAAGTMALGMLLAWIDEDPDHAPALLRDYLTLSPEVVGYVADEVERRAADGVRFDDQLVKLRSVAATGPETAAVALLAARAAEGAGRSEDAMRQVHEALAVQPDLPAALRDAGEYAACRGDVRAADGYLRRSGQPTADALRKALRPQLTPPKSATGRNQPCPCGSGRKYKACCLGSALHPLADRAEGIYALLATYAQRPFASEALGLLLTKSGQNLQSALLCVDLLLTDRGLTERFLRTRGDLLRNDERQLVESWQHIPIGLFEVRELRPNVGVTVRALPDGESIFLKDRLFSTSVRRLELFCGRILHDGTQPRLLSLPARVPREERRDLIELLAGRPSAEQLAEFFAPRPKPYLLNGDGHDYFDTEVVWEMPHEPAAWSRLTDRLVPIDDDILELHAETEGKVTSRGRVTREDGRWTLWANSRERLSEFEEIVRAVVPDAREVSRKAERMGGEPHPRARTLIMESFFVSAEEPEQDMWRRHRESWVDDHIEDLGMTPREAARVGGRAQAELDMLLDDMEWNNARAVERGQPALTDVAWIRRELQIETGR